MTSLIQNSFNAGLLSPSILGRTDLNKYPSGLELCTNWIPQVQGGIKTRPGMKYIGDTGAWGADVRLIPFVFNSEQSYVLVFMNLKMRIVKDGGFVVYPTGHPSAGSIVEIVTPYAAADLDELRYTQIFDTMYIVHTGYARYKLQRSDHHVWTFTAVSDGRLAASSSISATPFGMVGTTTRPVEYAITFGETLEGYPAFVSANVDDPWPSGASILVAATFPTGATGAQYARCYKKEPNGSWGIIGEGGFSSGAGSAQFSDNNLEPGSSIRGIPDILDPFTGAGNYPNAVGMFEQREYYGGSDNKPQTVYGSETALLDSFKRTIPVLDTDAVEFTLFSEMSERIMHFVSMEQLFVFTSESEKILDHGGNSDAVTPTSVSVRTRSRHGTTNVRPLVIGNEVLFVHRDKTRILNLFYSLEADGYDTDDLNMLYPEILEPYGVKEWAYDSRNKIIWIVSNDDKLFTLTYDRRQQVWAWAKHETDGVVYSLACISTSTGPTVYAAVLRKKVISGSDVFTYCLEELTYGDSTSLSPVNADSVIIYSSFSSATTLTGLDHLAGREVVVTGRADLFSGGVSVIGNFTVSQTGTVTLPEPVQYAAVGLPFTCTLRPVKPVLQGQGQTTQGMFKLVSKAHIDVINTRGLKISVPQGDKKDPIEVKPRSNEVYGGPSALQTGRIDLNLFGSWNRDGQVEITQEYPLPAHITSLVLEVELES